MKKYDIVKMIKEYLIVTLGVILVSFGLQYFYAPNDIAGGGLSGLALVINHYVPFLSTGTLVFLGNLILFVIAFLLIGSDFGAKTIYASFALSFAMDFMEKVMHSYALTTNLALAVVFGTLIIGTGLAIASAPASTKACIRSNVSAVTPTPAATRKRPLASLQAIGLSFAFVISL